MYGMYGYTNPRRRSRRRRNPLANPAAMTTTVREWTQGVDTMDTLGALGGLAISTMVPGAFVKSAVTMQQKITKLIVSFLSAVAAGAIGKATVSPSVGKAAVLGGLAGTAQQAIVMFTGFNVGKKLGATDLVSPPRRRDEETISVIQP